ncbi:hypothetical protein RDI58_015319 [Solanum bulbocastanum]|uniref:Uncharacterized protein n=1 Tax=Solanum bulbocastanum TaxID=147425 RepID=A0AAN8TF69_SOLBU
MILQDKQLYHTYYIAGTRMQPSSSKYENPLHAFELVFDKKSVLLELEENDVDALPLLTKLTLTSFTNIKQYTSNRGQLFSTEISYEYEQMVAGTYCHGYIDHREQSNTYFIYFEEHIQI